MASTARALYAKLSPGGTALGTVRDYYYFLNVCFECVYERERESTRYLVRFRTFRSDSLPMFSLSYLFSSF